MKLDIKYVNQDGSSMVNVEVKSMISYKGLAMCTQVSLLSSKSRSSWFPIINMISSKSENIHYDPDVSQGPFLFLFLNNIFRNTGTQSRDIAFCLFSFRQLWFFHKWSERILLVFLSATNRNFSPCRANNFYLPIFSLLRRRNVFFNVPCIFHPGQIISIALTPHWYPNPYHFLLLEESYVWWLMQLFC